MSNAPGNNDTLPCTYLEGQSVIPHRWVGLLACEVVKGNPVSYNPHATLHVYYHHLANWTPHSVQSIYSRVVVWKYIDIAIIFWYRYHIKFRYYLSRFFRCLVSMFIENAIIIEISKNMSINIQSLECDCTIVLCWFCTI